MAKKRDNLAIITGILDELYPNPEPPLRHHSPFTLLIAVLLSAQCTDKRVNEVCKKLFRRADTPSAFVEMPEEKLLEFLRPCGLFRRKTTAVRELSKIILDDYAGKMPTTLAELESLPGVGHKTASVVMAQAFGKTAMPVDTHIHRLAQRWELSSGQNVRQTERDLCAFFPRNIWSKVHLQIIFYGREYCPARACYGLECRICRDLFPMRTRAVITKKA